MHTPPLKETQVAEIVPQMISSDFFMSDPAEWNPLRNEIFHLADFSHLIQVFVTQFLSYFAVKFTIHYYPPTPLWACI